MGRVDQGVCVWLIGKLKCVFSNEHIGQPYAA